MEPLLTLLVITSGLLLLGAYRVRALRRIPSALRGGLAAMFLLTGISHFIGMREEMIAMVPDIIPAPELTITLTGIAELAGAIGLLIPRLTLHAATGLTLLLIGVFPANVALALSGDPLAWHDELPWRTFTQLVYLAATSTVMIDRYRAWRSSRTAHRSLELADSVRPGVVA